MINKIAVAALVACMAVAPVFAQNGVVLADKKQQEYGVNIVRISPITAMDVGVGFGVSYERIFGAAQMVGIVLPVTLLLENKNSNVIGYNNTVGTSYYDGSRYNTYVYFTPGVKIYPFGQRKVTYAVGPSVMLGYGGGNEWQYVMEPNGRETLDNVKITKWRLGLLVNNYVNFQVGKSFNLGLEGGLGMRYLDRTTYSGSQYYAGNGQFSKGFDITGQFSFTLGYRF